jgi:hypothetical protein
VEAYSAALDADNKNRISITLIGAKKGLVNQRKHIRDTAPSIPIGWPSYGPFSYG